MNAIHFLKSGKFTDSHGTKVTIDDQMIKDLADNYDPAVHKAPIVVGHPKDNSPAFGWVSSIDARDTGAYGSPDTDSLNADFLEGVKKGAYRKVSASLYLPDSPNNPRPGKPYLRHIGFLGGQPPAIKGLEEVSFADSAEDEGILDLADNSFSFGMLADMMRGLREWIISRDGKEEADKVLPNFYIQDLEMAARTPSDNPDADFSDPGTGDQGDQGGGDGGQGDGGQGNPTDHNNPDDSGAKTMTKEEIEARSKELDDRESAVKAKEDEQAKEADKADLAECQKFVQAQVSAGRVLPAHAAHLAHTMHTLDGTNEVEFSEEQGGKATPRDAFKAHLESLPKQIDFGEYNAGEEDLENTVDTDDALSFSEQINKYRTEKANEGITVSAAQAATALTKAKASKTTAR